MTHAEGTVGVWGVIPAAGLSRRMGRAKQSLPYRGSTVTGTVVRTVVAAGIDRAVVVTRSELSDRLDLPQEPRLTVVLNDASSTRMIDSVKIGLDCLVKTAGAPTAVATPPGVLVIPGDMPAVSVDSCRRVIGSYRSRPGRIVVATLHGRRGHPIVFSLNLRRVLDELEGGLNELAKRFPDLVAETAVDDEGVMSDIDTVDEYDDSRP